MLNLGLVPIKSQGIDASLHGDQPGIDHNSNGATWEVEEREIRIVASYNQQNSLMRLSSKQRSSMETKFFCLALELGKSKKSTC